MADVDHPKTHVEDQAAKGEVDLPRKQPKSPQHEGIDPLTESDTMYPRYDDKGDTEREAKAEEKEAVENLEAGEPATDEDEASGQLLEDQQEVEAKANTPNDLLPESDGTGKLNDGEPTKPGEKVEAQEPHTDKGNTSPANRTPSKKG